MILTLSVYAQEEIAKQDSSHRIYIEPDVFLVKGKYHFVYEENPLTFYSDNTQFGLIGGYEYLKPNGFFANIEALYSVGKVDLKYKFQNEKYFAPPSDAIIAKIEGQLGTNLQFEQASLIPYIGIGEYFFKNQKATSYDYIPVGLKWKYAANGFDLGLNGKWIKFFHVQKEFDHYIISDFFWDPNQWGYEISASVRMNTEVIGWDVQFEPYIMKLVAHADEIFYGGRLSMGYNF